MSGRYLLALLGYSIVGGLGSARAEEPTQRFAVQPGESLAHFLSRAPLCRDPSPAKLETLSNFLAANPERMDAHGNYAIGRATIELPTSLLDSAAGCRHAGTPVAAVAVARTAAASVTESPESGHDEAKEGTGEKKHEGETRHDEIRVGTFVESSQLHANGLGGGGGEVVLDSKAEYGVAASYYHALTESWSIGARYKFAKTGFHELEEVELKESFSSMQEASAGLAYRLSEGSRVYLSGGAAQRDHVTFVEEDNAILVDAVWVPKVSAQLELELFQVGKVGFGAGLQTAVYLPAGPLNAPGLATEIAVTGEYELNEKFTLSLEIGGEYQRQGFTNETHSIRGYSLSLGVGGRL